eukprot:54021-Karenia_brevis.AAC.1
MVRTKYDLLFESGFEAFRLHKSVVETLGVPNFHNLFFQVQGVIQDIEASRSVNKDGMNEATSFVQYLDEITEDYDFNDPDAHII